MGDGVLSRESGIFNDYPMYLYRGFFWYMILVLEYFYLEA